MGKTFGSLTAQSPQFPSLHWLHFALILLSPNRQRQKPGTVRVCQRRLFSFSEENALPNRRTVPFSRGDGVVRDSKQSPFPEEMMLLAIANSPLLYTKMPGRISPTRLSSSLLYRRYHIA